MDAERLRKAPGDIVDQRLPLLPATASTRRVVAILSAAVFVIRVVAGAVDQRGTLDRPQKERRQSCVFLEHPAIGAGWAQHPSQRRTADGLPHIREVTAPGGLGPSIRVRREANRL